MGEGSALFRVQDSEGRGPFRPGFTRRWCSDDIGERHAAPSLIDYGEEFIERVRRSPLHVGTGCRSLDGLWRWFRREERRRLARLGYSVVRISPDHIFGEDDWQVIFGRRKPLREGVVVVPWSARR